MENLDVIIIGGGAAGLTAGVYGVRSGLKTLILEEKMAGGATADAPLIENYPGFSSISGRELTNKMVEQCKKLGVDINELERVVTLQVNGQKRVVKTNKSSYRSQAVIIASGCHYRKLGVCGEEKFRGRGVSYCAVCDGHFFKNKHVLVVGGGNSAAASALFLSNLASKVSLVHRRGQLRAEEAFVYDLREKKVEFLWNTELKRIEGDAAVERVILINNKTGNVKEIEVDGIFVQVGETPNSQFAKKAGVNVDTKGYIIVDRRQRTNIEGVYAAGDVTNSPLKQVATAIGGGAMAATEAFGYIKRPYYYKR
jgi:thioredoxin reductase (NADPH)